MALSDLDSEKKQREWYPWPKRRHDRFAVQPDGSVRRICEEEFKIETCRTEAQDKSKWRQGDHAAALLAWLAGFGCVTSAIEDDVHLSEMMEAIVGHPVERLIEARKTLNGWTKKWSRARMRAAVIENWPENFKLWPRSCLARR